MKKLGFSFLMIIVLFVNSFAQKNQSGQLKYSSPSSQNFSIERLNRIDSVLQQHVNNKWCAGAVALVARNGKIVYHKALGYDDVDSKSLLKKDAIFRIASQTKAITSVGVMILYEEGKFLLDDQISKYIPDFNDLKVLDKFDVTDSSFTTVDPKREVTIRDLLTHTSGIGYPQIGSPEMNAIYAKLGIGGGIGTENTTLSEQMEKLTKAPLFHQPGERFTYGLNTDLLGYLIEVISGMSLDKFLAERIFNPLGMHDTYFIIPKEKQSRLATLYSEEKDKTLKKINPNSKANGLNINYPNNEKTYPSGGAGLSSTILDYSKFLQMLLNNGEYNGKRILSRNTVRMMTMNQIGDLSISRATNKFGLGFEITTELGSSKFPNQIGSFNWGGIFSTSYWVDPKEKIVAQLYLQKYPNSYGDLHNKFKVLVYQAIND
ncbi:MAG: beta-lactamase family protein [Melioribacteraceae bacterium]|nr:beta-lactamase family protein [Melioribacteraceae bacterium]